MSHSLPFQTPLSGPPARLPRAGWLRVVCALAALLAIVPTVDAAQPVSPLTFKFTERQTRTPKVRRVRPTVGDDFVETKDTYRHTILATLSMEGVELGKITQDTTLQISTSFANPFGIRFGDDPTWTPGGRRSVKVTQLGNFLGKPVKVRTFRITWTDKVMKIAIAGTYLATTNPPASAGVQFLPINYGAIGATVDIQSSTTANVTLADVAQTLSVKRSAEVPYAGVVKVTTLNNRDLGSFNRYTASITGATLKP